MTDVNRPDTDRKNQDPTKQMDKPGQEGTRDTASRHTDGQRTDKSAASPRGVDEHAAPTQHGKDADARQKDKSAESAKQASGQNQSGSTPGQTKR